MQTTVTLDDELVSRAAAATGISQPEALIRFALTVLTSQAVPTSRPRAATQPFALTGPFARGNAAALAGRSAAALIADLEDEAFLRQQVVVGR